MKNSYMHLAYLCRTSLTVFLVMAGVSCQLPSTKEAPAVGNYNVSREELRTTVAHELQPWMGTHSSLHCFDNRYSTIANGLAFDTVTRSMTYPRGDANDCDDFAWMARAKMIELQRDMKFNGRPAAFGVLWAKGHSFNIFLDPAGKVKIIDPTDGFISTPKDMLESWVGMVDLVVF
jgi:hypothetical protein